MTKHMEYLINIIIYRKHLLPQNYVIIIIDLKYLRLHYVVKTLLNPCIQYITIHYAEKNVRQLPKISDVEINIVVFCLKNGMDNAERTFAHLVYFGINEDYKIYNLVVNGFKMLL